jgi:hypothetical protein
LSALPDIHVLLLSATKDVDRRVKPGDDEHLRLMLSERSERLEA